MIIPSIDLQAGHAVQLIGGETKALDAGDPRPLLERFSRVGETAVIDLDAALGDGSNEELISELCRTARVRVGGGIRTVEAARKWLDRGAAKVIVGTAATPEFLGELPRERVIAALDARDGEVVVEGWRTKTGASVPERMAELRTHVGGFLVTFVEREGRMGGTALDRVDDLIAAAGDARVTFAGGVTTVDEIAALDRAGADAQVGMALYSGSLGLTEAFAAPLVSDREDGLYATVVCDESERALGLAWSSRDSLALCIEDGRGAYHSRRRGPWVKGATSGATQRVLRVDVDCDRDALRVVVEQAQPGFCHRGTATCWGAGHGIAALERTLLARKAGAPEGSYSKRLFDERGLLGAKLVEEAGELAAARTPEEHAHEAADVVYFTMAALAKAGVPWSAVTRELDRRAGLVSRRPGDAKSGSSR